MTIEQNDRLDYALFKFRAAVVMAIMRKRNYETDREFVWPEDRGLGLEQMLDQALAMAWPRGGARIVNLLVHRVRRIFFRFRWPRALRVQPTAQHQGESLKDQ